jgi:hypothetical protein
MNDYWTGTGLAHLDATHISAPWGRGSYCDQRISFANELFQFWYNARRNIAACTDHSHQTAMTRELVDAGKSGAGFFSIDDLEEAFEHIHSHGGRWTDDTASLTYFGNPNQVFRQGGLINDMPKPFVKFAQAVDRKFQALRSAMNNFDQQTQIIEPQLASSRPDWDRIGTALTQVSEWGERAKPFLWARPRAARVVGTTASFASALSNIHSGASTYAAARSAHFPHGPAVAIGVLRTAVGFIPVLGAYYGGMVDLIPSLRTWFTNLVEQRVQRIDRAINGRP